MTPRPRHFIAVVLLVALALIGALVQAAIVATNKRSDIRNTKHNLSVNSGNAVRATNADDTQVCVFCHTPHSQQGRATTAPLWNRQLSAVGTTDTNLYTPYSSSTIDAYDVGSQPGGSSKLCLSCHDGTMAIDTVNVLNGASNVKIPMQGLKADTNSMPDGGGSKSGFTRNLGKDLSNDHPISFTYDDNVATRDGELRKPSDISSVVGIRTSGTNGRNRPTLPLEATDLITKPTENGQMQCTTCHDPHLRDLNSNSNGSAKFLRLNRFQTTNGPSGSGFTPADDIICLACHDKAGVSWAYSAHANKNVANYAYASTDATTRDFPAGVEVWQVSCLNCHDTHTAQGARRLLRQGVESNATANDQIAALENTCYQCHGKNPIVSKTVSGATVYPPKIEIDFTSNRRMPITSDDQNKTSPNESHDIGGTFNEGSVGVVDAQDTALDCKSGASGYGKCGKDFLESRTQLAKRHVECTDCHNPHRVVKFQDFRGLSSALGDITKTPDGSTHPHDDSTNSTQKHTNIASGALRGSWGVEPNYDQTQSTDAVFGTYRAGYAFSVNPPSFTVKRGDPGTSTTANVSDTYVTREYQVCLKCHSNYAYGSSPPTPGTSGGTTPSTANSVTKYTNQAMEFQAPSGHEGPATNSCNNKGWEAGAKATTVAGNFNACNHRSWHPVMKATGRTLTTRNITTNSWRKPWSNDVGGNTMFCSDCHGANTTTTTSVVPDSGSKAWGPHGSANDFVLKGAWTDAKGNTANLLCFKCHDSTPYSGTNTSSTRNTGFYDGGNTNRGNLHRYHANKLGELRCTWCHVAVPHGWKNKALLVNLNDLGPEVGKSAGTVAPAGSYTNGPYYYKAVLRITSFAKSGAWSRDNCGGGQTDSNATSYMKNTMCSSPP